MNEMKCKVCGEVKPLEEFFKAHTKLGRDTTCIQCRHATRKNQIRNNEASSDRQYASKAMKKYIGGWARVEKVSAIAKEHGMSYGKWKALQRRQNEASGI